MQRVARQNQPLLQFPAPSVLDVFQIAMFGRTVNFVTQDGMSQVLQYLFSSPEMCGFSYEASLVCSVLLVAVIGVLCLFRGSGLEKAEEPNL